MAPESVVQRARRHLREAEERREARERAAASGSGGGGGGGGGGNTASDHEGNRMRGDLAAANRLIAGVTSSLDWLLENQPNNIGGIEAALARLEQLTAQAEDLMAEITRIDPDGVDGQGSEPNRPTTAPPMSQGGGNLTGEGAPPVRSSSGAPRTFLSELNAAINGDREATKRFQQHLKAQGHDPGPIDGIWGPRTEAAFAASTGSPSGWVGGGGGGPTPAATGGGAPAGGGPPAPAAGAAASTPVDPAVAEADLKAEISRNYGYLAAYFDHLEVGPRLRQAAAEGWDNARLMGALYNTNWWQSTAASARLWDAKVNTDSAEANRLVEQTMRTVHRVAAQSGVVIPLERQREIATSFHRLGWDENDLVSAIGAEASYTPGTVATGDLGNAIAASKEAAASFFVKVDEETHFRNAQRVLTGELSLEQLDEQYRGMAYSKFPQLKNTLDQGYTLREFFSAYQMEIAEMLGMAAVNVDLLNDQRFAPILDVWDDRTQTRRPMTISEARAHVRTLEDWNFSEEANAMVDEAVVGLGQRMGVMS